MITHIEVVSSLPGPPALPLGGFVPNDEAVQILGIEGLGPVKADLSSSPFATGRGEQFQGGSTGKRNLVFTFGLNPNWVDQTMGALRQLLYQYFMPETWAKYKFFTDELPEVEINGIVESFEPNIFSQDPQIQVSVICPKPDFIEANATLLMGKTLQFPIEGIPDPELAQPIGYSGTVPSGFELRIHANEAVPAFEGQLFVSNAVGDLYQELGSEMASANALRYLKLNTVRTMRQFYNVVYENQEEINILARMEKNSSWPEFSPGENKLMILTSQPGLDWTLGYFNRFGGL